MAAKSPPRISFRPRRRRLFGPQDRRAQRTGNLWIHSAQCEKHHRRTSAAHAALGAAAPDPATVVITLERPAPYLPELLTQPCALPLPPAAIKTGPRPNATVSDGPYLLKSWIPNDHVTLVKNPGFYDATAVKIDTVNYFPTADTEAALRRLRAGELDMQTPLPSAQVSWLKANMPDALHILPSLALAYIAMNLGDPALADSRVRRALNLVYDRRGGGGEGHEIGRTAGLWLCAAERGRLFRRAGAGFQTHALCRACCAGQAPDAGRRLRSLQQADPDLCRHRQSRQQKAGRGVPGHGAADLCRYPHPACRTMRWNCALFAPTSISLAIPTGWRISTMPPIFSTCSSRTVPAIMRATKNPKFDAALDAAEREADIRQAAPLCTKSAEQIALGDLPWLPILFFSQSEAVGAPGGRLCAQSPRLQPQPLALDQKIRHLFYRVTP